MQPLVATRIREAVPTLPKAERRAAQRILAASPVAGHENVARLALRAGVSGPTVIRLVTRLGYDGYPAFQAALRSEIQARATLPLLQYERRTFDGDDDAVSRSRPALSDNLDRSLSQLDARAFADGRPPRRRPAAAVVCRGALQRPRGEVAGPAQGILRPAAAPRAREGHRLCAGGSSRRRPRRLQRVERLGQRPIDRLAAYDRLWEHQGFDRDTDSREAP